MDSRKKVTLTFLFLFVAGFVYLFLTYKTPYQQACDLEKEIKREMLDIEKEGIQWIRLDSSSVGRIEKDDFLFIEESFVLVDSVNTDSVGIYSPKGLFDLSKQDLIVAKSFLFKKGTFEYEYAKRGILLEETQKTKKILEDTMKKEEAKKKREKKININSRNSGSFYYNLSISRFVGRLRTIWLMYPIRNHRNGSNGTGKITNILWKQI